MTLCLLINVKCYKYKKLDIKQKFRILASLFFCRYPTSSKVSNKRAVRHGERGDGSRQESDELLYLVLKFVKSMIEAILNRKIQKLTLVFNQETYFRVHALKIGWVAGQKRSPLRKLRPTANQFYL